MQSYKTRLTCFTSFTILLVVLPMIMGIQGILYAGPIADLMAAVVTVIMARLEFKAMRKLEKMTNK